MSDLPQTKKALGQHWLTDGGVLDSIIDTADANLNDVVLEIGPGAGTLTERLVEQVSKVVAVEFDELLARDLPKQVPAANLEVVHQDILKFNVTTLPKGYKVIANIPYYLTSNLLRVLSESTNPPSVIVLLVQQEVAERVAAKPGDMSLLSVSVQFYYEPALGQIVPASLFIPPPKVSSRVLKLVRREVPLFTVDAKRFFAVVKAGFNARRKTLVNSLSGGLRMPKADIEQVLQKAGINPQARPQELSLQDWYSVYQSLET